jgi:hypothetical protein
MNATMITSTFLASGRGGEQGPGADPGFQVGGAHFKKLHRAEGGAKFFWVFRVKNHDFTPKNHISNTTLKFHIMIINDCKNGGNYQII